MKGIYLTKGVLDIFDKMEKASPLCTRVVAALKSLMNQTNAGGYVDRVLIGKGDLTLNILKDLLGSLASDSEYENFIKIFSSWSSHMPPETNLKSFYNKKDEVKNKKIEDPFMANLNKNMKTTNSSNFIKFTDDFWLMTDKISDEVCWALYELDKNANIKNTLKIEKVDVSERQNYFDIINNDGRSGQMTIFQFIKYFFPQRFNDRQISNFARSYNSLISRNLSRPKVGLLELPPFKYTPNDVRATFLSLVTETYPYGTEDEVMKFMPKDLTRDEYGNYYKIIGNSNTMFTSHLDTVSRTKDKIGLVAYKKDGEEFIVSDGTSILGADDKAGVSVLLYMMHHKVPGTYFFFYGEERGGIGSGKVANNIEKYPFLNNIKKCISFDRKNYYSVITMQHYSQCCSDEFATSLCKEFSKGGLKMSLDPTGVFTDSANFTDLIPECTNVSVGYFNEHTHDEIQNITYLEKLAKACVLVDWDKLVIGRRIGFDDELMRKFSKFISDFRKSVFYNKEKMKADGGKIIITFEINDYSFDHMDSDMVKIDLMFKKHNIDPDITFGADKIKFEIK